MNKKLFAFLLSVVVLLFGASLNTWAQGKAKKPRVVVVPSDRLLNTMGVALNNRRHGGNCMGG